VISVRVKRVSKPGATVIWLVTVPTIRRALELVSGEVMFVLIAHLWTTKTSREE